MKVKVKTSPASIQYALCIARTKELLDNTSSLRLHCKEDADGACHASMQRTLTV